VTSLAQRAVGDELMDAHDLPADTYAAVVRDLARVNTVTLAARPTLAFLRAHTRPGGRYRLLDVGYGDGDMLRRIARWGERRGVAFDLVGIDLNPRSEVAARADTPAELGIDYRTGDYDDLAGEHWDFIVSSLVAHHMTTAQPSPSSASWIATPTSGGWSTTFIATVSHMAAGRCSRDCSAGIRSCAMTAACRSRAAIVPLSGRRCSIKLVSRRASSPSFRSGCASLSPDRRRRARGQRRGDHAGTRRSGAAARRAHARDG